MLTGCEQRRFQAGDNRYAAQHISDSLLAWIVNLICWGRLAGSHRFCYDAPNEAIRDRIRLSLLNAKVCASLAAERLVCVIHCLVLTEV